MEAQSTAIFLHQSDKTYVWIQGTYVDPVYVQATYSVVYIYLGMLWPDALNIHAYTGGILNSTGCTQHTFYAFASHWQDSLLYGHHSNCKFARMVLRRKEADSVFGLLSLAMEALFWLTSSQQRGRYMLYSTQEMAFVEIVPRVGGRNYAGGSNLKTTQRRPTVRRMILISTHSLCRAHWRLTHNLLHNTMCQCMFQLKQ